MFMARITKKIGDKCTVCGEGVYEMDYPGRYQIVDQNTDEIRHYIKLVCSNCGAKIHGIIHYDEKDASG